MKTTIKYTSLPAIVLIFVLMAGCMQSKTPQSSLSPSSQHVNASAVPSSDVPAERTVTDMAGRTVTLPAQIKTIGTIGSIGVLNAFVETMGAGDRICNEGYPRFTKAANWEKYQYKFTPQIKDMKPFQGADSELLMENIFAVKPDLCLTTTATMTQSLEEQGFNVIELSWTKTEDVKLCIGLLGEILSAQDIASDYLKYFDDMVAKAGDITKDVKDEDKKTVAYGTISSFTQPHVIAEWWIAEAGGISVTAERMIASGSEKLVYTLEDLLNWNPDVIFVPTAAEREAVMSDERLSEIIAVKNSEVYVVPRVAHVWGNRTTEQPLTIMWALNKLYPELLTKDVLAEEIAFFYSHFFKYDFTEAEIEEIIG